MNSLRPKLTALAVVACVTSSCSGKNQFSENSFIGKVQGTSVNTTDTQRKAPSDPTSVAQKGNATGEGLSSTSGASSDSGSITVSGSGSGTASGSDAGSGAGTASGSGSGTASGSDAGSGSGTASGSDAGSGSGAGSGSTSDSGSNSGSTDGRVEIVAGGLAGGHFDFDSYSKVNKKTGFALLEEDDRTHTHAYDDEFRVTGADFFDLKANHVSVSNSAAASARFAIVVVNAGLSNKAVLNINGRAVSVVDYENSFAPGNVPAFTISNQGLENTKKLTSFSVSFPKDAIAQGGLKQLDPDQAQDPVVNDQGAYRNGALVIRIVNYEQLRFDPATGKPATDGNGVLWESVLYWHKKD